MLVGPERRIWNYEIRERRETGPDREPWEQLRRVLVSLSDYPRIEHKRCANQMLSRVSRIS